MKKLIYTQSSGFVYTRYTEFTAPLMKQYADRIGADFHHEQSSKKTKYPLFEKFKVRDFFKQYDRILFLDCDILIRPYSPDIFAIVPEGHFAALNEGALCDFGEAEARWQLLQKAANAIEIPVDDFKMTKEYYNGGVFVVDRIHQDIFEMLQDNSFMSEVTSEQNVMSIRIHNKKHKTFDLPIEYNYMSWRWSDNHLRDGHFIHYAGMKSSIRYDFIKRDYEQLINNSRFKLHV